MPIPLDPNRRVFRKPSLGTLARLIRLELKHKDPPYFNLIWIRKHVYQQVEGLLRREGCCMPDGTVILEDLLELLPDWRDRYQLKTHIKRSFKQCIIDIISLLELEDPEEFGPKWIYIRKRTLHNRMADFVINDKGKKDWSRFRDELIRLGYEKWANRFTYMGIKYVV